MASQFEHYAYEGDIFLKKVAGELGTPDDTDCAFRVSQAVFYALRDRITVEESQDLISPLPMAIKAVYVNGWKLGKEREKYKTRQEFLNAVYAHGARTAGRDLGDDPRPKVQAVFKAIKHYVSEGEMRHVRSQLPREIADLLDV
jgi:uncharacterized protein (DUF2267 family)